MGTFKYCNIPLHIYSEKKRVMKNLSLFNLGRNPENEKNLKKERIISYDQEDLHFETIQKSFAHYKNEYQRLLEENNLLQEENQKVRQAFDRLKEESAQLQNLMAMVTGEMGTALSMIEKATEKE